MRRDPDIIYRRWKSAKRGSLSFGRHRRDVTGRTREIYRAALLRLDLRCS